MYASRTTQSLRLASAASRSSTALSRNAYRTTHTTTHPALTSPSLPQPTPILHHTATAAFSTALCLLSTTPLTAEAPTPTTTTTPTPTSTSSTIRKDLRNDMPNITLYQYETCPFCNKVRAFLDFHSIPYKVIEVDPLKKKQLAFSKDYRKVPIAILKNDNNTDSQKQINGSGTIIATINQLLTSKPQQQQQQEETNATKETEEEKKWIDWIDNHLIHLISPNIYQTPSESLQTFNYITSNSKFTTFQQYTIRYSGAIAMYFIAKRLKKKYGIQDARAELYQALDEWMNALKKNGGKYLGGKDSPGMVDLSVFGVMRACENFETFRDIRRNRKEFVKWFDEMKVVVGEPAIIERL